MEEVVANIQNEVLVVGSFLKNPDYFVEYGIYVKSKYDFSDKVCRFIYENIELMYKTQSTNINQTNVNIWMSENEDRLKNYRSSGGWNTIDDWMNLAETESFKNYFEILKKYSLLREYARQGFNVKKIMEHRKFQEFKAMDIYKLLRAKVDKINTVILTNKETEILNENISNLVNDCLLVPDMGIETPFSLMTDIFRGLRLGTMFANGALSNSGKSRYMFKFIAFIALVLKQKVCVLLNEMSNEEMKYCLLTTVINNPEYQKFHGVKINKKEKEITLGLYKDANGEFVHRKENEHGEYIESIEDYKSRLYKVSEEYRNILKVAEWIEKETKGIIYSKDISDDYSDETLLFEIRKHNMVHGVKYFAYDTMKNDIDNIGDWSCFKITATKLSQIIKELNIFLFVSLQLNDEAQHIEPLQFSGSNLAECKAVYHVLDSMTAFKHLKKDEFDKYYYLKEGWGTPTRHELDRNKNYAILPVLKNRAGRKTAMLFEVDLDYNTWIECGEVFKK